MLLAKIEALVEFTVSEEIFQNLTFPEHIHHLLHVMNETLPSITSLVSFHTHFTILCHFHLSCSIVIAGMFEILFSMMSIMNNNIDGIHAYIGWEYD